MNAMFPCIGSECTRTYFYVKEIDVYYSRGYVYISWILQNYN